MEKSELSPLTIDPSIRIADGPVPPFPLLRLGLPGNSGTGRGSSSSESPASKGLPANSGTGRGSSKSSKGFGKLRAPDFSLALAFAIGDIMSGGFSAAAEEEESPPSSFAFRLVDDDSFVSRSALYRSSRRLVRSMTSFISLLPEAMADTEATDAPEEETTLLLLAGSHCAVMGDSLRSTVEGFKVSSSSRNKSPLSSFRAVGDASESLLSKITRFNTHSFVSFGFCAAMARYFGRMKTSILVNP
mmetsp:Transcript_29097/g.70259  ORF Transcript_29097/g.70259 Transcript_29097/m.70259 type:complete len:245 (-) Transcript_29097:1115-1849(-)